MATSSRWSYYCFFNLTIFYWNFEWIFGFDTLNGSCFGTPYRSGIPIDSIPTENLLSTQWDALLLQYQSLVESLNWLAHTTHPELLMVVSLLAQHQNNPSNGHLEAAKHVVKYLTGTKTLGIYFTSKHHHVLESFLHFPLPSQVVSMSDANQGPQDASITNSYPELPLFVSHLMSFLCWSLRTYSLVIKASECHCWKFCWGGYICYRWVC